METTTFSSEILTAQEIGLRDILQNKVNQTLERKTKDIGTVIEKIQSDNALLNDFVVPTGQLKFSNEGKINVSFQGRNFDISEFSVGQMADKYMIPRSYLKDLAAGGAWQKNLASEILNKTSEFGNRDRVLIREVNGKVRAFLSDSYKRFDSMQLYVSFLKAISEQGALLLDAFSDESKDYFEVIHPQIVPVRTELNGTVFMSFGARLRHSDYGDGALEMRTFNMQAVCLNGMVTESKLREVHLGKKLPDDIALSAETVRLDSMAKASLISDTVKNVFSPENLKNDIARIQRAGSIRIDFEKEIKKLPKMGMLENEIKNLTGKLMLNNENDGIKGEASLWKLAQAIGAVAKDVKPDRTRELNELAGQVMLLN